MPINKYKGDVTAPGFSQWIPLPVGPIGTVLKDPLQFQLSAQERFGDVVRFRSGPLLLHFLYHPDHVRRVLHDAPKNYLRGWQYKLLQRLFGNNLVAAEGDFWLRQRRLTQPAFHRQRLSTYSGAIMEATENLITQWEKVADTGRVLDVVPEMSRLALAVATRAFFSRDMSHEADTVGRAFGTIQHYLQDRYNYPFTSLPAWVPTNRNRRFTHSRHILYTLVRGLIQDRHNAIQQYNDLLSMLLSAEDPETGEKMDDEQLCSEVLTFLIAGHETTATALAWTLYFLGKNGEIRKRAAAEVKRVLGDRSPSETDLPKLLPIRMILEESMRLCPPIWIIARQAIQEDSMGEFRIPARSTVLLSQYVTHRHSAFWDEPELFNPERFRPDLVERRPKGVFFPFLGGPHQCIGQEFAMFEMQLVLIRILQSVDWELLPGEEIRPRAALTLRPNAPVQVRLTRR